MSRPQADGLPSGLAPRVVAFCDELRREGLAVGTSEILDAFEALETVPWEQEDDFREALAATVAARASRKSSSRVQGTVSRASKASRISEVPIATPSPRSSSQNETSRGASPGGSGLIPPLPRRGP